MKRKIAIGVSVGIISACVLALFFFEDMVRASTVPDVPFDPTAVPEAPDYADSGAWASLPSVASNAMLVPGGIERSNEPPPADVFFIHPTTYLDDEGWNAPTDGPLATELLDQFVLAIQPVRSTTAVEYLRRAIARPPWASCSPNPANPSGPWSSPTMTSSEPSIIFSLITRRGDRF